jgi:CheY-like chemotaxis protein
MDPDAALTILVVDDDALVGMALALMVEDLGHVVLEARSGQEALERIGSDPSIDLVITDQSMPGMKGTELAERLALERPDLPVILASGYEQMPPGQENDLPRLGKPFDVANLAKVIRQAFSTGRDPAP